MKRKESEVRAQLLEMFEKAQAIEGRYETGLITDENDQKQMTEILGEIDTLEKSLEEILEGTQRHARIAAGLEKFSRPADGGTPPAPPVSDRGEFKDLGALFVEHDEYSRRLEAKAFEGSGQPEFGFSLDGSLLEMKTLLYSGSGDPGVGIGVQEPFESRQRRPGYLPILYAPLTFLDLFPRVPTGEELIEYVKENSFTNNAAMISEATATTGTTGTKPESAFDFTVATSTVKDLAHWIPVTNKLMRNAPALRGIINQRLLYGLDDKIDDQVLNGDGTGNNLLGLLSAGIQVQAKGSDSTPDAVHKAITKVRVTGLRNPNFLAMHPNDWQEVRLLRDESAGTGTNTGSYLWGSPATSGPLTMWGMPVLLTQQLAEGTGLVGFSGDATIFDRERANIRVGTINDQFTRNMYTILAEAALAFIVWRPNSFCQVTGI